MKGSIPFTRSINIFFTKGIARMTYPQQFTLKISLLIDIICRGLTGWSRKIQHSPNLIITFPSKNQGNTNHSDLVQDRLREISVAALFSFPFPDAVHAIHGA